VIHGYDSEHLKKPPRVSQQVHGIRRDSKNSGERVEFDIKLPGRGDDDGEIVWLPIDAKFPIEDYQSVIGFL
jgi:DNA anti-recombination protein RmuC